MYFNNKVSHAQNGCDNALDNMDRNENLNTSASSLLRNSLQLLEVESSDDDMQMEKSETLAKIYCEIDTFLKSIFKIVHAVPATQVSVERAFSALKLPSSEMQRMARIPHSCCIDAKQWQSMIKR